MLTAGGHHERHRGRLVDPGGGSVCRSRLFLCGFFNYKPEWRAADGRRQETVAPLLCMQQTSMIAISTLTSSFNFYSRLIKMRNKVTGDPLFSVFQVQLACDACIEKGAAAECVHRLHLIPRWQSSDRHEMLKTVMQASRARPRSWSGRSWSSRSLSSRRRRG